MKNTISKSNIELRHLSVITAIAVFAVIFQFLSCCEDCPTCPESPQPPEMGNYRLYAFDSWNQFLMSVDIPTDTIVDSVRVDYAGDGIFVTPDGERLLVMAFGRDGQPDRMEIISSQDLTSIGALENYGYYYFDGSDDYGIWYSYEMVYFIDPVTLTPFDSLDVINTNTRSGNMGYLDTITDQLFISGGTYHPDSLQILYQIDCISHLIIDSTIVPLEWGDINRLAYNRITNDIYLLVNFSVSNGYFRQYDLTSHTILNSFIVKRPFGSIAISPDGKLIYMTDSGNAMTGENPEHPIWIFDAVSGQPICWIPPHDSTEFIGMYFGQLIPTPDSQRIYLGSSAPVIPIVVIDHESKQIINTISPFTAFGASAMALGPK